MHDEKTKFALISVLYMKKIIQEKVVMLKSKREQRQCPLTWMLADTWSPYQILHLNSSLNLHSSLTHCALALNPAKFTTFVILIELKSKQSMVKKILYDLKVYYNFKNQIWVVHKLDYCSALNKYND